MIDTSMAKTNDPAGVTCNLPDAATAADLDTATAIRTARRLARALNAESAVAVLRVADDQAPLPPDGLFLLANCYANLRDFETALATFDRAITAAPADARGFTGRSLINLHLRRMPAALADAMRATTLGCDDPATWTALGRIFSRVDQHDLASTAFATAHRLAPNRVHLKGLILREQLAGCLWTGLDTLIADIDADIAAGLAPVDPFFWQVVATSNASLQTVARRAMADAPSDPLPLPARPRPAGMRLRIGYVSGELNTEANAICMAGVFDAHDTHAFEVIAFDNGRADDSALRRRIASAFADVVPIADMDDRRFASAVADRGIDVLINLNGFFGNERSAAFRHRPAPVQVNYLGSPGTMGASYMDYIIADDIVIAADEGRFYDEEVVRLPDTYYPTDRARPMAEQTFTRADCGLPDTGVVFCCFNTSHKILPDSFAGWMRILLRTPGSVLWLIATNPVATRNLHAAATAHGIDPARLIFASYLPSELHLARHRLADLALDTLPYNAHTTACDALWSGVPILTRPGTTFPSRVATSLLTALDLPELIATTAEDYERRAVDLAHDPAALARVRTRLQTHRLTTPLFDTVRYTRHLEAAYRTMVRRHHAGLPPAGFTVPAAAR
jgi:tetratricopeptide (TPR) repeat protein